MPAAVEILVDADACPVKAEIFKVAERHGVAVQVVANSFINLPRVPWIRLEQVAEGLDVADDWIAAHASPASIVITADIPLADRCVKAGATVLAPTGKLFDENSIGMALATRNLMTDLRSAGEATRGPRPFSAKDRSAFLSALHEAILRLHRRLPA
ncbi:YaiI/YqxD family protein [Ferrovibrio sp.]|uniref:YaiI/YqxD family protein n=1 Tax=Ferrovibrio sp. TaxID=1917215 RepID=UPI003D1274FB